MNSTTKTKKEPASVGAETSSRVSKDTNNTIVNNTPENTFCQEANYIAKYNKLCDCLCYIDIKLERLRRVLDEILADYDFLDPLREGAFSGAACMRTNNPTESQKNGLSWIFSHDRIMTFVNIADDYASEINKILDKSGEV